MPRPNKNRDPNLLRGSIKYIGDDLFLECLGECEGNFKNIPEIYNRKTGKRMSYTRMFDWVKGRPDLKARMVEEKRKWTEIHIKQLRAMKESQRKIAQLKKILEWRKKHEMIRYYAVRPDGTSRGPHKHQDEFHRDKSLIRIGSGGNRCLSGDTQIYDPVKKKSSRIDEIRDPFFVYAWDGKRLVKAKAKPPFKKGTDKLYRVMFSNGEALDCTLGHRVLTPSGWSEIGQLTVGSVVSTVSPFFEASVSPLQNDRLNVRHSMKIIPDFQFCYPVYSYFCDRQPLFSSGSVPDIFPLQDDVLKRSIPAVSQPVSRVCKQEYSHFYRLFGLLSSLYEAVQIGGHVFAKEIHIVCRLLKQLSDFLPTDWRSIHAFFLRLSKLSFSRLASLFYSDTPFKSPLGSDVEVINITYLRTDVYYDFTVPIYHNYWSKGLIHHNSGKSTCSCTEAVSHMLGYRPWLKPDDPDYKIDIRVPNKGLIVAESYQEQVKKVIVPKLLGQNESGIYSIIPIREVDYVKRNPQGVITYIRLKNQSECFLQSYDQDIDLFESADYDWAMFDEPPPRSIWVAVQRGLADRQGRSWIGMTPLKEPWLYDEVYNRVDVGLHYFDIEDNLDYGLTRKGIDQFSAALTSDEKESRLRGRYFHLTGLVYKKFGLVHVKKRDRIFGQYQGRVPVTWGLWMHIDTHPRTPHHAVWLSIDPAQRKYICGELKNSDTLNRVVPFCEAIKIYERTRLGRQPDIRLIDPIATIQDPNRDDAKCMKDIFSDNGINCASGSKNRDAAILLFQNELNYDLEKGHFPNIFVLDDLEGVRYELAHYIWDEHVNTKVAERSEQKQTPRKKNDHFIEGIHRILLDDPYCPSYKERQEIEPPRVGASSVTGY